MAIRSNIDIEEVKNILTKHLEANKLRKTPERYTILEEIYKRDDHFEAETLFIDLRKDNFNVSRATVYNTLDLLLDCNLIMKHQFGKSQSKYEKSFGYQQHDHIICEKCNKVIEFCDPRIEQIQSMMGDIFKMDIKSHSLVLYGECNDKKCKSAK